MFTYLKGQLNWHAADCISGFSLTSRNYKEAVGLLKEHFGNAQIIIAAHSEKVTKVVKAKQQGQHIETNVS